MSQCSPKISQDIKSDIQCPPLKWPPFWPLPPSGPSTPNFSFHSTEIFDFRVAAKKQRKNYILPPPLTFFGKSKTKNWKISVEFKMVKSLNTRFLNKKKRFNIKVQHKKTNTFFHAKKKKIQKKANSIYLHAKIAMLLNKKKLKRKITKTPLYPRKKKDWETKKNKSTRYKCCCIWSFSKAGFKKKHKYIVRCSMPEWRVRNTNKKTVNLPQNWSLSQLFITYSRK